MKIQTIPFNDKCKSTAAYIILCALIALLSCFAAETPFVAVRTAVTFAGDLAVLTMFTLYFVMTASALSEADRERRSKIFCTADCCALVLKIVFTALCSLSGDLTAHITALIADTVFSRVYVMKRAQRKTDPANTGSI